MSATRNLAAHRLRTHRHARTEVLVVLVAHVAPTGLKVATE